MRRFKFSSFRSSFHISFWMPRSSICGFRTHPRSRKLRTGCGGIVIKKDFASVTRRTMRVLTAVPTSITKRQGGTFIRRSIWRSWRSCLRYRLKICWMTIKRLYGGCCQLCGENAFREFNADISEAHHIAYFSDSQNNDSSNIIILCPNHHRLIHKLNPKFDYNRGCFVFSENSELRIELDFHLMK